MCIQEKIQTSDHVQSKFQHNIISHFFRIEIHYFCSEWKMEKLQSTTNFACENCNNKPN